MVALIQRTFIQSVDQVLRDQKDLTKQWIGSDGKLLEQTWWRRVINWFTGSYDSQTARILTSFGDTISAQQLHEKGDISAFYHAFSIRIGEKDAKVYADMKNIFSTIFPLERNQIIQAAFVTFKDSSKSPKERNDALTTLLTQPEDAVVIDTKNGKTPLHYIIEYGKETKFKEILGDNLGAYMEKWKDIPDAVGMTPLLAAAQNGNLTAVKLLEEYKADRNIVDATGNNLWHHVFIGTDRTNLAVSFLTYMVEHEWDKDQQMALNEGGLSPFHLAFLNNNKGFVALTMAPLTADEIFTRYKEDLIAIAQQQTKTGQTAFQLLVDRFQKQGNDTGSDIHFLLLCLATRFSIPPKDVTYAKRAKLPLRLEILITKEEEVKQRYENVQSEVDKEIDGMSSDAVDQYTPTDEKFIPDEKGPTADEREQSITNFIGKGKKSDWWRSFLIQDRGKELLEADEEGLTPLHHAMRKGDLEFLAVVCDPARKYELVDWSIVGRLKPPVDEGSTNVARASIAGKLPEVMQKHTNLEEALKYYLDPLFEKQKQARLYAAAKEKAVPVTH